MAWGVQLLTGLEGYHNGFSYLVLVIVDRNLSYVWGWHCYPCMQGEIDIQGERRKEMDGVCAFVCERVQENLIFQKFQILSYVVFPS